jgi:hypothetical protein
MTFAPRSAMQQGSARARGTAPTAAILAATQSQRPPEPTPPPPVTDFIRDAYGSREGNKMTAKEWQSTANTAVQTHGYDSKDLQRNHSDMLRAGQIKRSRVRFTGYQWNHDHNGGN